MKVERRKTERGFVLVEFLDRLYERCSLQKSSLATEDTVWLVVDGSRVELTREMAAWLIVELQHFVKTGELKGS